MRYVGEVLELTQECELGSWRERCVVVDIEKTSMVLVFPSRSSESRRSVMTGTDYLYLRKV